MITLRSATCAATLSMWLLPGYCGCLLSLALSCTLMAIEVVFEFVLLPCLQFLLLCVALPMWLVLAYYFFEALHYVSSWCSKWWSFRVNSVSGYNRGSSYRKVRRWLRRFWLNTCDNLSHSLFCVRRWASATKRHWAQPLRESSAAARAAFFSTRTSSSRLARRKNSRMQKTDRTKGGGEAHRREGPGLLLLPFAGLGCSGFVASFCCVFGAMMVDKLPAVTFYYGVMSGALPVALATASINNNPPRKNHLQHLDDGSEGIAGTEVVHNSTSVDDGELSNAARKRKQKMRVNYSGEMTDIQEDEEIPTASSSFVVVSTGQGTREGTISAANLGRLETAVTTLTTKGDQQRKEREKQQQSHEQKQFDLQRRGPETVSRTISSNKEELEKLQKEQQTLANWRPDADLSQALDLGLKLVEDHENRGDGDAMGQEISKLEQNMLRLKYSSPLSDKLSPVVFTNYVSDEQPPFVRPQDGDRNPVEKQQVVVQFENVAEDHLHDLRNFFAGPRYYITFNSKVLFSIQAALLTEEVFLRMCREGYTVEGDWAEANNAFDTNRYPWRLSADVPRPKHTREQIGQPYLRPVTPPNDDVRQKMESFQESISGRIREGGKIRKVKILADYNSIFKLVSSPLPLKGGMDNIHRQIVYSSNAVDLGALNPKEKGGSQDAPELKEAYKKAYEVNAPFLFRYIQGGVQGMVEDMKNQKKEGHTYATYEVACHAESPALEPGETKPGLSFEQYRTILVAFENLNPLTDTS